MVGILTLYLICSLQILAFFLKKKSTFYWDNEVHVYMFNNQSMSVLKHITLGAHSCHPRKNLEISVTQQFRFPSTSPPIQCR